MISWFGDVRRSVEMTFDRKDLAESLLKLISWLVENKVLEVEDVEKGFDLHLEFLEDNSIDVPASPRLVAQFVVAGIVDKYLSWSYLKGACERYMMPSKYAPKFLSLVLQCLRDKLGPAEARKVWSQSSTSVEAFGVENLDRFVQDSGLGDMFPIPRCEKEVLAMLRAGRSNEDVIQAVPALVGQEIDHDVRRCLLRCVLTHMCEELGGPDKLAGRPDEPASKARALEDPRERELLQKRAGLLKKWLTKRSEQALALFEVQKFAQLHSYPQGLCKFSAPKSLVWACFNSGT